MSKETRRDMKQRTARKGYVHPVVVSPREGASALERLVPAETALEAFVECVDMTGGVRFVAPVADPEWLDLGEAYMLACKALGRDPKVAK